MSTTIEAPTDSQLLTIRHMCDERGLGRPEVVWSKQDASEIIAAIIAGSYRATDYLAPSGAPTPDDVDFEMMEDDDDVPF